MARGQWLLFRKSWDAIVERLGLPLVLPNVAGVEHQVFAAAAWVNDRGARVLWALEEEERPRIGASASVDPSSPSRDVAVRSHSSKNA